VKAQEGRGFKLRFSRGAVGEIEALWHVAEMEGEGGRIGLPEVHLRRDGKRLLPGEVAGSRSSRAWRTR